MKRLFTALILIIGSLTFAFGQNSTLIKINKYLKDKNFSIRKTFDGSKNENKPANFSFFENHNSNNDFLNLDIALKLSELELLTNSYSVLIFYPKIEWHKSTDSTNLKNKLEGGINFEFIPFGLKSPNLPSNLPNNGLKIAPLFLGTSSLKKNFIDNVFETKLSLQMSLVSNYKFFPGSNIRDKKDNFRARYYPYFGFEYNRIPDLISNGQVEEFSTYFFRFFTEIWILPQILQLNVDGTYRKIVNNNSIIRTNLPILYTSINIYPGKQELLGIGYEYTHGYEAGNKFELIQISSIKLICKI